MSLFSNDRSAREFKAWASDRAIRLDIPLQSEPNLKRLAALDSPLENKRIVYLGEPDHFIHEKYDYRLLMLRYLISRRWNQIGEEIGEILIQMDGQPGVRAAILNQADAIFFIDEVSPLRVCNPSFILKSKIRKFSFATRLPRLHPMAYNGE